MFPVLFSYGPFELRTLSIFLIVAFICSSFIFWRKGREEHYNEGEFFDGFLLASLIGFIAGRVGFIALNYDRFGLSVLHWLDIFAFPGINGMIGLIAATIYLYRFARKNKWDIFEVLDFWVLALATGLTFGYIGLFFDGTAVGKATTLPVGLIFPGLIEPHHPAQLYAAAFFLLLSIYLSRVEYRYRTFEWYRSGKKTAQTGFLVSMFLIVTSLYFFLVSWVKPPVFMLGGIDIDRLLALATFIGGLVLLYSRSGRAFFKRRAHMTPVQPPTQIP
jgi:phosphatidylglycerol:prolipoprotein diacylglycerol transferase